MLQRIKEGGMLQRTKERECYHGSLFPFHDALDADLLGGA
jgi:hypothetical protein